MTVKVFYGEDRGRALREVEKFLGGKGYEAIEGAELLPEELPNIFQGASLLTGSERRILIRDALEGPAGVELANYAGTPHRVAILETKIDARGEAWKKLVGAGIETQKFELVEVDKRTMFDIYRTAKRDGARAVEMLEKIRAGLEPKAFVGVLASQAFKDYGAARARSAVERERRILRELAKLDMDLGAVRATEASPERPWMLIKGFLMRVGRM